MYDTIITERNLRGDFRFNKEILIYLLEPCVFCFCFLFVFFFDNIQTCIQFYNLQRLLFFRPDYYYQYYF